MARPADPQRVPLPADQHHPAMRVLVIQGRAAVIAAFFGETVGSLKFQGILARRTPAIH